MGMKLTIAGLATTAVLFTGASALWAKWGEAAFTLGIAPIFCF